MNIAAVRNADTASAADRIADLAHGSRLLSTNSLRNADASVQRQQVASQFEAIIVRQLLGPTMKSMLGESGGAASDVYGDMLTDSLSQKLAAGSGFGLARMVQQQLTPRHAAAATTAASSAHPTS